MRIQTLYSTRPRVKSICPSSPSGKVKIIATKKKRKLYEVVSLLWLNANNHNAKKKKKKKRKRETREQFPSRYAPHTEEEPSAHSALWKISYEALWDKTISYRLTFLNTTMRARRWYCPLRDSWGTAGRRRLTVMQQGRAGCCNKGNEETRRQTWRCCNEMKFFFSFYHSLKEFSFPLNVGRCAGWFVTWLVY